MAISMLPFRLTDETGQKYAPLFAFFRRLATLDPHAEIEHGAAAAQLARIFREQPRRGGVAGIAVEREPFCLSQIVVHSFEERLEEMVGRERDAIGKGRAGF